MEKAGREMTPTMSPAGNRCSHLLLGLTGSVTLWLALFLFSEKETEAQRESITHPRSHSLHRARIEFTHKNALRSIQCLLSILKGQSLEKQQ